MGLEVTSAILFAAFAHAAWNSLLKGGEDPLLNTMLLTMTWVFICGVALIFAPVPAPASWPYIFFSVIFHIIYFFFLAKTYEKGDISTVYPIIRGLPPLLVAMGSYFFINDNIGLYGWAGILLIGGGIFLLEKNNQHAYQGLLKLALATAIMIAAYTLIDGVGVRVSGDSNGYLFWSLFFKAIIFTPLIFAHRGTEICLSYLKLYWRRGLIGGALSILSYAIVLWAMTKAPIAYVSALRETSVLFVALIAVLYLGEPFHKSRMISAIIITIGIIAMKLG